MRAKLLGGLAAVIMMLGMVGVAQATTLNYTSSLNGANEVPSNASQATGNATGTYDDVTNLLTWSLNWADLTAAASAAHFQVGPVGVNGPVQVVIPNVAGFTSGSVSSSTVITDLQEQVLLADNWYINIHDSVYPGGEIRGQVTFEPVNGSTVPEPSTFLLLGAGLGGLALLGRKAPKQ